MNIQMNTKALKKTQTLDLRKVLHTNKFNPVQQLIQHVYPQLEPEDQARILMQLIGHLYTKPIRMPTKNRTTNTVNIVQPTKVSKTQLPYEQSFTNELELQDLLKLAGSNDIK